MNIKIESYYKIKITGYISKRVNKFLACRSTTFCGNLHI
jgi:hypothetical protein